MIRVMLSHFGLRKTMLIKAGIDAVVLSSAFLLIRERFIPDSNARRTFVWYDKKFLKDPIFWSISGCVFFCNFGFPVPFFYLPTYSKQNIPNLSDIVCTPFITTTNFLTIRFTLAVCPFRNHARCLFRDRTLLNRLRC